MSRVRTFLPLVVALLAVVVAISMVDDAAFAHEGREIGEFEVEVGFLHEPAFEAQPNGAFIKISRPGVDLESHGALFSSGTIEPGGNFEFEIGHHLEDLVVPFHDHLTGQSGTITVAHDAESTGTVMVQFNDGFSPSELSVQPGTTVMFMNTSGSEVMTVLSGPHDEGDGHSHEAEDGHAPGEPVIGAASTLQVEITHVPTGETRTMGLRPLVEDPGAYLADFVPTAPGAYNFRYFGDIEGEAFDEIFTSGPNTFDEVIPSRSVQFPIELRETRELQSAVEGLQTELDLASDSANDADTLASTALVIGIIGLIVGIVGFSVGGYGLVTARRKA